MERSIRRTLASAGVAAMLIGGVAACGDDDNGVDTGDTEEMPGVDENGGGDDGGGIDGG